MVNCDDKNAAFISSPLSLQENMENVMLCARMSRKLILIG